MKNKLFFLIIFFSFNSFAKTCYEKNNYFNFFYLNGINVSRKDHNQSILSLKFKLKIDKIHSFYNPTFYQKSLEEKINDLKTMQKKEHSILKNILNWSELQLLRLSHYSVMGSSILNDAFLEVLPQKIDEYSFTIDWNPKAPTINFDYLKYTNSFDQVKEFSNQLHKDKLNVIIAHSQGNLIANELCYNNQKLNIQIVSIASPAGALPCNQFKNYALYDEDFVIENLKKITNRSFHYLKSNFSGYDHLLSGYLNNPEVLSHLNQTLTKTKNYIYDKNLNFNIYSDEPSFSFIDKDICVIKTIGDFKKIQSAFTGMALNNNGTKCFTLRNKHTFSDEEIKSLTLTSLGSNFNQIVSSLIQIYQNNPELIQHLPNIDYKKFINPVCNNLSVGSFYFISNQQKKKIIILKNDDGLFQFNVIDSSNGRNVSSSPFSLSCTRLQDLNKSNCTELVDYLSK